MKKKNNCLLPLFLACLSLSASANDRHIQDPFAPAENLTANLPLRCANSGDWLMDNLPLAQLKPIGVIEYQADNKRTALWLTENGVVIDSGLNQVIAQEQWQIVQIDSQRIRLQLCQDPTQQKTLHL